MSAVLETTDDISEAVNDQFKLLIFQEQIFEDQKIKSLHTYAIIDGASNSEIKDKLEYFSPDYTSLFPEELTEEADCACPWLVRLKNDCRFTHWFIENVDRNTAACIFRSQIKNIKNLRDYYASYSIMEMEQSNQSDPTRGYFAFYDPRVFQAYLSNMNNENRNEFFYPVSVWYFENQKSHALEVVAHSNSNTWQEQVDLNLSGVIPNKYEVFREQDIMSVHISPLLTQKQITHINVYNDREFCVRVVQQIHMHYPGKIPSFTAVEDALRYQQQAISLGLLRESEQATYILGASLFGSTFITNQELRQYIQVAKETSRSAAESMQELVDSLIDRISF